MVGERAGRGDDHSRRDSSAVGDAAARDSGDNGQKNGRGNIIERFETPSTGRTRRLRGEGEESEREGENERRGQEGRQIRPNKV